MPRSARIVSRVPVIALVIDPIANNSGPSLRVLPIAISLPSIAPQPIVLPRTYRARSASSVLNRSNINSPQPQIFDPSAMRPHAIDDFVHEWRVPDCQERTRMKLRSTVLVVCLLAAVGCSSSGTTDSSGACNNSGFLAAQHAHVNHAEVTFCG